MKTTDLQRKHFSLTNDEPIEKIKKIIEENKQFYSKIRVRSVLAKCEPDDIWLNVITVFHVFQKEKEPLPVKNQVYEKYQFLEFWADLNQIEECCNQLKQNKILLDGVEILLRECGGIGQFEFKSSSDLENPLYFFQADSRMKPNFPSHEPIISSLLPIYPSVHSAVRQWSAINNVSANSHLFGSVFLIFPEVRAWFSELEYLEDGVCIHVEKIKLDLNGLKIKGVWEANEKLVQVEVAVDSEKVTIKAPENSTGFSFYLVDEEENLFDFYEQISGWAVGQKNILPFLGKKKVELEDQKIIKESLSSGEGVQIEYKSFVKKTDKNKIEELIETTIAFLNTSGGRILIGVNDNCGVDGIEKEVFTNREKFDKELEAYCGFLKQTIGNAADKPFEFSVSSHKYDGHWVVVINIAIGNERPYQTREKLLFFTRRGASNKRATSEEVKKMILQTQAKENDVSGTLLGLE